MLFKPYFYFFLESDVPTNCPSQWWPYAGHCYRIHREEKKIQKDALIACRKEGGDLASIHSIEEFDFIISQLGYGEKPQIDNTLCPSLLPSTSSLKNVVIKVKFKTFKLTTLKSNDKC